MWRCHLVHDRSLVVMLVPLEKEQSERKRGVYRKGRQRKKRRKGEMEREKENRGEGEKGGEEEEEKRAKVTTAYQLARSTISFSGFFF